jgi:ABC-2 type transport system permease protein
VVGAGTLAMGILFTRLPIREPLWLILFTLLACGVFSAVGIIAGIWADKFDQLAGFQNFIIVPLTFLSGVFYSIHSLPAFWQAASHVNPVFYMIDGFRYGFLGISDVAPTTSLIVVLSSFVVMSALCLWLLKSGYKLRH